MFLTTYRGISSPLFMAAKIHLFTRLAKLFFAMSKNVSTFAPDFDTCPGGGMVDTIDSKSVARKGVRVQVPPGVQEDFVSNSK